MWDSRFLEYFLGAEDSEGVPAASTPQLDSRVRSG
jgi:hypothetical protein